MIVFPRGNFVTQEGAMAKFIQLTGDYDSYLETL